MPYGNEEVVDMLQHDSTEHFTYLWGESGSGKSHLLKAWTRAAHQHGHSALYLDPVIERLCEDARSADYLAIDHIDNLDENSQIGLFSIYNTMKQTGHGRLLMAGRQPPMHMIVRDDLRTRLGWGLVFEIKVLDDQAKLAALQQYAAERQLQINNEVFRYLLTHWRRDLSSLTNMLNKLDRYSLATHRPITIPLLKQLLHSIKDPK